MRLSDLKTGESATVLKVSGHGGFRRRIMEMGFVRGQRVEVKLNAPLHDPIEYRIMGYDVSLRRSEAEMISVITNEEAERRILENREDTDADTADITEMISRSSKHISVALVGNPNSGKTSLFNAISGSHEHVGNYSGVTVDAKLGRRTYKGYSFEITDLPGTYALSAYSPEEIYVRRHLADRTPDVIINAVVASNLERNLYLTTELIDINPRMVVALNMYDELTSSGATLDYESLGGMLGVPMVPVVAKTHYGIEQLLDTVIAVFENEDRRVRHIHINHGSVVEEGVQRLDDRLRADRDELPKQFPPRYYAMKLLEGDKEVGQMLRHAKKYESWIALRDAEARRIETQLGEDVETAFANQKYGFISGALRETYTPGQNDRADITGAIDLLVTHRVWGFPIFFLIMWFMFYCTFNVGAYPQRWIEILVESIGSLVGGLLPEGPLHDLVIDGIIGGVGSVIVFLPNIVILYLFISFMEDSGYLARAAFIMDKVMHRIGLHGKSFIPLIMGFGCNVPAIMATRTIESRSSRLITLLILPFMSCSARLPIYILVAGTFFPHHAGMILFVLYVLGIGVAVVTARHIMRRFMFPVDETPFVMELPPYRVPTLRTTLVHMWEKCAQYLRKMGGLILVASVVVWFLSYYPAPEQSATPDETRYENSYLGRVGKFCEPAFKPLGLNWKSGVSLLSGVAAKEIVVSTMGVLYADEDTSADGDDTASLSARLTASGDFSAASAFAFLVFTLLYFPCLATVSAITSEAGWRWAAVSVVYNTAVAWLLSWGAYHLFSLFL